MSRANLDAGDVRMAREIATSRRALLQRSGKASLAAAVSAMSMQWLASPVWAQRPSGLRTLQMPAGPNYPYDFAPVPSGDLVIGPLARGAVPVTLAGTLVDDTGRPLAGGRVELWQCDALGRYHHDNHSRAQERDRGFVAFGWQRTDEAGRFAFRTVMVGRCEARAPHFHLAATHAGRPKLITQLFLPDHADNANDYLYPRLTAAQQALHTVRMERSGDDERALTMLVL
jgi:protocatechuate 3,4-dioxygenase, beta subunit